MSTNNRSGNGLMIAALAAVLGFAAVYVTMGPRDNASSPPVPAENAATAAEPGKAGPKSDTMAAFVTKKVPEALPDITFTDGAGKEVKLSDFKGRTVLLNLWATWCAPCREEMPALDRLQEMLGSDKFEVVALSLDRKGLEASKKFLDDTKATHLKLYADPSAKQGNVLKIVGMPTTILIDGDGRELGRLAGPAEWDSADAKKLIEAALQ